MSQGSNYSQLLRPIGQMLESLGVQSFILTVEGDDFSVRGQKPRENSKPNEVKSLRAIWQSIHTPKHGSEKSSIPSSNVVELHYAPDDIEHMEIKKRAKQKTADSDNTPETHALSQ